MDGRSEGTQPPRSGRPAVSWQRARLKAGCCLVWPTGDTASAELEFLFSLPPLCCNITKLRECRTIKEGKKRRPGEEDEGSFVCTEQNNISRVRDRCGADEQTENRQTMPKANADFS
jgi:hypothetical protein